MKRLLLGMLGLLLAGAALADGAGSVRKRVEGSMLVTGTIEVAPDGTVSGYRLDRPEKLPPVVIDLLGKSVPHWTFQPVLLQGRPVPAKARMSLRLGARPQGDGSYEVAIRGAYFGEPSSKIKGEMRAPGYPGAAIDARVAGTVYLLLRIDPAGKVSDAVAEQVNLEVVASDTVLKRWRRLFANVSIEAARRWTFNPVSPEEGAAYRVVRVPVAYRLHALGAAEPDTYGQWQAYIPGPVEPAPWLDAGKLLTGPADALPGDGVYGQSELLLLTPLDHG